MHLAPRDQALLQFLDRTPATAQQILRASVTFAGEGFRDERRVRERLQTLANGRLVRSFTLAVTGGGLANYYKLTAEAYRLLHGPAAPLPHRSAFSELPPSRLLHTLELADLVTHTMVAAHTRRIAVTKFHRENELVLEIGPHRVSPDCHVQLAAGGRVFNVLFEIDRSTESVDSVAQNSIRSKLDAYEAYQDHVLAIWKNGGRQAARPAFRVAFLTRTEERTHNILAMAFDRARNPDRRLCYAATLDHYLGEPDALQFPLFLDHHGGWQALVNTQPTAAYLRTPIRINPRVQPSLPLVVS
jgi:hypothetical protein